MADGNKVTRTIENGENSLKTFVEVKRWRTSFDEQGPGGDWKANLVGLHWRKDDGLVEETWKWFPPGKG